MAEPVLSGFKYFPDRDDDAATKQASCTAVSLLLPVRDKITAVARGLWPWNKRCPAPSIAWRSSITRCPTESRLPLMRFDDLVLLACLRAVTLDRADDLMTFIAATQGSCRRLQNIDLKRYLGNVLCSSFDEEQRQLVLLDQFCGPTIHWPLHTMPILLETVKLDQRGKSSKTPSWIRGGERTPLWWASCYGHVEIVLALSKFINVMNACIGIYMDMHAHTVKWVHARYMNVHVHVHTVEAGAVIPTAADKTAAWVCPTCTFQNHDRSASRCEVCQTRRAGHITTAGRSAQIDNAQAILVATEYGHAEVVAKLVEHGADVDYHRPGMVSPAEVAAVNGRRKVLDVLIANGAGREGLRRAYHTANNLRHTVITEAITDAANLQEWRI